MAAAMVSELKSTVRPAVLRTVISAASIEPCWRISSTKSRHDEEAEVDRQTEPERDHQVEGEDRQRQGHADKAYDTQRHGNGEHRGLKRHGSRPEAAEHEEQQQDQERQREKFGPAEVLRGHCGDLYVSHRRPTEPAISLEGGLGRNGCLEGGDGLLLLHGSHGGDDNGEVPRLRDHG